MSSMAPQGGRGVAGYVAVAAMVVWCAIVHQAWCAAAEMNPTPSVVPSQPIPTPADGTVWVPENVTRDWDSVFGSRCGFNAITASANGDLFYNILARFPQSQPETGMVRGDAWTSTSSYQAGGMVVVPAESTLVLSAVNSKTINSYDIDAWRFLNRQVAGANRSEGVVAADGVGTDANFMMPLGMTVAPQSSTLYVADCVAHTIRKLTPYSNDTDGKTTAYNVTTAAGKTGSAGHVNGPSSMARFNRPVSVAAAGIYLYIADRNNYRVRCMDMTTDIVSTIVGKGQNGYSGDGGPATLAKLAAPASVAVDNNGALLFIADTNHVRVVNLATNNISTVNITGGWQYGTVVFVSAPLANTLYISTSCSVFRAVPLLPTPSPPVAPSPLPTMAYTPTPVSSCQPAADTSTITFDSAIIAGGGSDANNSVAAPAYAFTALPLALAATPNYDVWVASYGSLDVVRGGTVFWAAPRGVVERITAVAVTPVGDVWMYDEGPGAFRVMRAATGSIATMTYATGSMSGMTYANVWGEGSLLIADSTNNVVRQLSTATYDFVRQFGVEGMYGNTWGPLSGTLLSEPTDVAWHAAASTMYVAESDNSGVRRVNMASSSSYDTWWSDPMPNMPPCAYRYISVAVDGLGVLWVACPTSPSLVRVIGANTSYPTVVSVIPRPGAMWHGHLPYINVEHPLTRTAFDIPGHRVVRAGATDIIHTIPALPSDTPFIISAFVAVSTACLPTTATPTPSVSPSTSITASITAAPTAGSSLTPALPPTPAPTATPSMTPTSTSTGNSSHTRDEYAQADEQEAYPVWLLPVVGVAFVVGGFGTVIGGAALLQRCMAAGSVGGRARIKDDGAAATTKALWVAQPPALHVNPLATAAVSNRSGGGRPDGVLPLPAAISPTGSAKS